MNINELPQAWLKERATAARRRASSTRQAFDALKNPDTAYGRALKVIADADDEVAAVYARRLHDVTALDALGKDAGK